MGQSGLKSCRGEISIFSLELGEVRPGLFNRRTFNGFNHPGLVLKKPPDPI